MSMPARADADVHTAPGLRAPVSLSRQFAITGGLVMLVVMTVAGIITSRIVTNVTIENTAASTALFLDSVLSPNLQALAHSETLPPESVAALDQLLGVNTKEDQAFETRFPHLEIWKEGGLIVYSKSRDLMGRRFDPPPGLLEALTGKVSAQYTNLDSLEHMARNFKRKYLEIYVPVREQLSGRIIAVAEIHEAPDDLQERLSSVRLGSWLTTALLTLAVMLSLFGTVHRASKLISAQHTALRQRIDQVRRVSDQNRSLRSKIEAASGRLVELNATYLRNVAADLHDGPAQLVGLAVLKVELVRRAVTASDRNRELQAMSGILDDALRDLRTISHGLMLPEIESLPLQEVVERVVALHETRTGCKVSLTCEALNCDATYAVKICAYRFLQEGLLNAHRHAPGNSQSVVCRLQDQLLNVTVSDGGPAGAKGSGVIKPGLGLTGLRARVESLGGAFAFVINQDGGTTLEMTLIMRGNDGA
ncbi:sensor histidine kinase [Camelimonas sp. ID_303_24]